MEDKTSEVIILRVWEQCKFDEIAIIIGEKVNTVKQRFYRGIEKIKYELVFKLTLLVIKTKLIKNNKN